MKRAVGVTFGVLTAVAIVLVTIPATRDEIQWRWANLQDETASYEAYLDTWPDGRHAAEAKKKYDDYGWADAQAVNIVQEYERYILNHEVSEYVPSARDSIESIHWQIASSFNTVKAYLDHNAAYPSGRYLLEAQTRIEVLRTTDEPFNEALETGTEISLTQFLEDYPGHRKEATARQIVTDMTDGRDIVDLLREKKIEIEANGSGIENVSVNIRKLVSYPLTVWIPVGSFFVSSNPSAQSMVTTENRRVRLTSDDWRFVSAPAACANRSLDVPGRDDSFTVLRSPKQADLARLMPVLDRSNVDTETRQAAVWIVTDDADYNDLGILVVSQFGFGGSRVINEEEAARAMKICDEAGIDITKKAIWNHREYILSELTDTELKSWLEQRMRK